MEEFIGWSSATILLVTLIVQIAAQSKSDVGVSPWLFVGQLLASAGFIAYSSLKHDLAIWSIRRSIRA